MGSGRPVALVTGASSGIGAALARAFVRRGHDVILTARREDRLQALAGTLGERARVIVADLASPDGAEELHRAAGPVDVLVNNAGLGHVGAFAALSLAQQMTIVQVNIAALTTLTRLYLPEMIARGRGRILNLGSVLSFQPGPGMAVYSASKAYVLSLSEALHAELAGTGVTVTCLCPGATESEFAAQAGMDPKRFLRFAMSAERVALRGVMGTLAGERVSIPGGANAAQTLAARFLPRKAVLAVTKRLVGAVRPN